MRVGRQSLLTIAAALLFASGVAAAPAVDPIREVVAPTPNTADVSRPAARAETLWIFDADFEDLLGDNTGWTSEDRSGTLAVTNYWHKDTLRIDGFEHLGDSTWWCGTYNPCWRQPRGYGNDWYQLLYRDFPEVPLHTDPGDPLILEYDQRVAMELSYDYGYTDVSTDGGSTWTTVRRVCNAGFVGTPGISRDWSSVTPQAPGHVDIDLSDYAGQVIRIRFRFESDGAYSSEDQWNNPPFDSVKDGAWQLDNIALYNDGPTPFWLDDCESPGDNGWVHEDIPAHGQTGVTFARGLFGTDIWTNRPFTCDERSGWMYAAVDPLTSRMVDGENAWLMSPVISIAGAEKLVGQWDIWVDLPRPTEDIFDIAHRSGDDLACVEWYPWDPFGEDPGWWYGGPFWHSGADDWSAHAGNAWLQVLWVVVNDEPPEPGIEHMGGIFLNRQRVGIPTGDLGTIWDYSVWCRFNDLFQEQMSVALHDSAEINVSDADGIVTVTLVADNGITQTGYSCRREHPESDNWMVPPPAIEMVVGAEIHYHLEAQDGAGVTTTFPPGAPDEWYEFSILPTHGSVSEPCVLLVDKTGDPIPGEDRSYGLTSEDYFREALDILGYEYDVYDVDVPGGSILSNGPDTAGMKYYDTQVWFTGSESGYLIIPADQANLVSWLGQSQSGKERNLLLTGNDIVRELDGADSVGLLSAWLATQFVDDAVGVVTADSLPGLRDASGGFDFLTHGDARCLLRGGCPELAFFDVIQPYPGIVGAELVAEYVKADLTTRPAGVAYTDPTGYQAVTLGFGMELMSDALLPNGHFASGASDRVDLMANIMEYFEKEPTEPPTGIEDGEIFVNRLGHARPNPFNPSTAIVFSLASESRVTIRVFDCAGRVVRTLVDAELEAGPHTSIWDGVTDAGPRAASGVYFVRMEGSGDSGSFSEIGKAVMLK